MSITSITHKVSARFAAGAVGAAMIVSLGLGAATPALAAGLSTTQVQSILSLLSSFGADQATINNVQAALTGQAVPGTTTGGTTTGGTCSTSFTRTLQVGSTGADVKALQQLLNASADTRVAASGTGSAGMESTYFGPATKAAVIKFQNKYASEVLTPSGLTAGTGLVGAATRAKLNTMCGTTGGSTGGTTTPTGPGITVSAATQPANTLAPKNASRVPFTTFTLTNNTSAAVTVNGVTVQRAGLAQDAAFAGVVLLDQNGVQVGIAHTFNSNHQTNIGDNFVMQPGQSVTYTVAGNMASSLESYTGQVAQLAVVAVNTSVPVSGTLPIYGASQTLNNTLTIGQFSTSTSSYDPGSNQSKNIGDTNVRFAGVRFTANSAEDLKLYSIRWRQVGTASAIDFGNVKTYVDGVAYPAVLDSSGKYYSTVFSGGITIPKGNSVDVYIQGDITGTNASSRTVAFDIDKSTDVYFVGQTYGYGAVSSSFASSQPWFHNGYTTTIQAGSASVIQNAASVASANIPVNVNNTTLGGFQTNFIGEPVSVSGLTFAVATSSGATGGVLTSVSIVDENGAVIAGPVDQASTATNGSSSLVFSDTVTFPVGLHTYTLKGKVPSAWANNSTVKLSTTANSTNWTNPTGQTTGNTVTLPGTTVTMNQMTVKGAQLTVTASPTPTAQTIVPGTAVTLANVQLDASQSGEDIRLNSIKLFEVGTDSNPTELNTCQLYNGSTALNTGSNVVNSVSNDNASSPDGSTGTTFTFDNALTVPKGTVVTLAVKCNIATGGDNASYSFGVFNGDSTVSVTGVQSGSTLVRGTSLFLTTGQSGLQLVSTGGGSFTLAVDSSSPSYGLVPAGTNGVTLGVYKLRASFENISLQKLALTLTNSGNGASSGSGAPTNGGVNDLRQLYIYQGSTLVGYAQFTGADASVATSTLINPITLTKDVDTILTVKADLADIGVSGAAGVGDVVKVDPLNAQGAGLSSGQTINKVATGNVSGVQIFKSYPTFAAGTSVGTNPNGTAIPLKKFSVTANASGAVGLNQIAVALATSSASVRNLKLFAYTDSNYSQPANVSGTTGGQFGATAELKAPTDTASPTVSFIQGTPLQVPAGSTYYFSVVGDVSPKSDANNWTISVTVLGDSATTTSSVAGYNASYTTTVSGRTQSVSGVSTTTGNSNFVWSDNATTTSATGAAGTGALDWFNGFYVPGLPSTGF